MSKRGFQKKYLAEFVYGSIDGAITTFAIVTGAVGASLNSFIILILGFANLFADGFSMAISNYLATKSQKELDIKHKHAHPHPAKAPRKTALVVFLSFLIIGFIPLISFVIAPISQTIENNKFLISFFLTAVALVIVGAIKGEIVEKHYLKSALETLSIGGIAALIAFAVGYLLKSLVV